MKGLTLSLRPPPARQGAEPASWQTLLAVGVGAFVLRATFVVLTPQLTDQVDLSIYRETGGLAARGINPFDERDHPEVRQELRTDAQAFNAYVAESQSRWDYYVSGNLPLTVLVFRSIEIFGSSARVYRMAFALFDSLMAVLLVAAVHRLWHGVGATAKTLLGLSLAAIGPVQFLWGTVYAEDKGLQSALMVASILAAVSPTRWVRTVIAPLLLGGSVAFKGLGIFIAPLCAVWAASEPEASPRVVVRRAAVFLGIAGAVVILSMLPYFPEDVLAAWRRFRANSGGGAASHDSPWRLAAALWPEHWRLAQRAVLAMAVGVVGWAWARGRVPLERVTASALVLYVMVFLTSGSLDRMNIAVVVATLLMGVSSARWGAALALTWFLGGAFLVGLFVTSWRAFRAFDMVGPVVRQFSGSVVALVFCGAFALCLAAGIAGRSGRED
jgi:hypothetical protein